MAAPMLEASVADKTFRQASGSRGEAGASFGRRHYAKRSFKRSTASIWSSVKGEVVGLVGESGCGKSTLGRMVAGILEPSEGDILFRGSSILGAGNSQKREAALKVQMIFQDPFASLNPRMRVADIIGEAPLVHGMITRAEFE